MGRGGGEGSSTAASERRPADRLVHPAPAWALEHSTWTRVATDGKVFFVEAPEDEAASIVRARTGFNVFAPGSDGDYAGELLERCNSTFVKASAFDRNAALVSTSPRDSWDDCHVDETTTHYGRGVVIGVEHLLQFDKHVEVIRAEEIAEEESSYSRAWLEAEGAGHEYIG